MPDSMAQASSGLLLIVNGHDRLLRWDGLSPEAETSGVEAPLTAPVITGSGTGLANGEYTAYVRYQDRYGNYSDLSPVSAEVTLANVGTITYSQLPVPTDPKITRRQILRNTAGQGIVYYVDIDTLNLSAPSLDSQRTDDDLATQEAVPLLTDEGIPLANRHGLYPTHKSVIAAHGDRMFAAVDAEYAEGSCQVAFGSKTVTGIGTEWTEPMAGRILWVAGASKFYEIANVDIATQTLTLEEPYLGLTDLFAVYAIRPVRAERRLLYWAEPGEPEYWPAINAIPVQETGDDLSGLMSHDSFLYLLEQRHIHRFTFGSDPAQGAHIFRAADRGCINNRCWILADGAAYLLDDRGIYSLSEGEKVDPLSTPIQAIFNVNSDAPCRINWAPAKFWHAAYDPSAEIVRWFVTLTGAYLPRHALAFHLRSRAWWIEEYPLPIGSSAVGHLNGRAQLFLGSSAHKIFAHAAQVGDVTDTGAGTCRGTVTLATPLSLTDAHAVFPATGVVQAPVRIVAGAGKGQWRKVIAVSGTTLTVDRPWLVRPNGTSLYQLGGIAWTYRTGAFRFSGPEVSDESDVRRAELVFKPTRYPQTTDARLYFDRRKVPADWLYDRESVDGCGVATTKDDPDAVIDWTKSNGFAQLRLDAHKERYVDGIRFLQLELAGVTNRDTPTLYSLRLDGVEVAQQ